MKFVLIASCVVASCFAQVTQTPLQQAQAQVAQAQTWLASVDGVIANFQGWLTSIGGALAATSTALGQVPAAAPPDPVVTWAQSVSMGNGQTLYQVLQGIQKSNAVVASITYTCGQPPMWLPSQPYALDAEVEDPAANIWQLTGTPNAGVVQSGTVAPAWPTSPKAGTTVMDGVLTWTFVSGPGDLVCSQGAIIPVIQPVVTNVTPKTQ